MGRRTTEQEGSPWEIPVRDGAGTRRTDPEEAIAKIQAAAEEMTMHRYVHSLPVQTAREWEREALWRQMRELNQVLDYQNKILVEILAALDRLTRAVGEMGETG